MRKQLIDLVKNSILLKYNLPYGEILNTAFSTQEDFCYYNKNSKEISTIIYNSIIEFSKNEFQIDYDNLGNEQLKALKTSIRYDDKASDSAKQRLGFFGEVLFYSILKVHFHTEVFISKGYFYSPLERSEPKGYDIFNLIERNNKLELWFGESKFYIDYKCAIKSILDHLSIAISNEYLNRNILAIITQKSNITTMPKLMSEIVDKWELNPDINISEEIKKYNIKLIYPIFIAFDIKKISYSEIIKKCICYIKDEFDKRNIKLEASFNYSIFFIFLPLSNVKQIKGDVINCITTKEPLI